MKTSNIFKGLAILMIFMTMLLIPAFGTITADMTVNDDVTFGKVFTFATQTDSIENDTSRVWSLGNVINKTTEMDTNKLEIPCGYHVLSATATVKVAMKIQGSYDYDPVTGTGTWIDAVTINSDITSETATKTVINFGLARFPYYRTITDGQETNTPDTVTEFWLYVPY